MTSHGIPAWPTRCCGFARCHDGYDDCLERASDRTLKSCLMRCEPDTLSIDHAATSSSPDRHNPKQYSKEEREKKDKAHILNMSH